MPIRKTVYYQFGGSQTVTLWTEKEVAAKLKMSIPTLRERIASGSSGIPYHISENVFKKTRNRVKLSHKEYFFNNGCWDTICEMAKCNSR